MQAIEKNHHLKIQFDFSRGINMTLSIRKYGHSAKALELPSRMPTQLDKIERYFIDILKTH